MSSNAKARLQLRTSGGAVDAFVAERLHLSDGQEVDVREEDGRIVIESIRPKILEPVSDVDARAERAKLFTAALDEVATEHRELFALLAR